MTNVCEVVNVKNVYTGKQGIMRILAYKYTEEEAQRRDSNNMGLVFFFSAPMENNKYVMSFVLSQMDVQILTTGNQCTKCVNDLAYILTVHSFSLEMYDIATCAVVPSPKPESDGFIRNTFKATAFELAYELRTGRAQREVDENGCTGFMLAIKFALEHPNEGTDLVPHSFPVSVRTCKFNYME